ncbi:MAG: ABC transporter substrate-binding protein [Lachnospiraceae bacterium]|nr:ABC transporter substrate-binding protein [Lachnospiraceae bacterium]
MKKFYRLLSVILAAAMLLSFSACGSEEETTGAQSEAPSDVSTEEASVPVEKTVIKVAALKGPTAMGMVQLMDDTDSYEFTLAGAVDEVTPLVAKGEVDIAAVPANLASVLYNNLEGKVAVIAVNTLGVLYIVDHGAAVSSVADLKGKTIYASGQGATPEYALNYILQGNGIDPKKDVTIEWKSEHAECVSALMNDAEGIAMLPQPFVTTAQMKDEAVHISLDLNEEWDKVQTAAGKPGGLLTGVAIVRKEFAEAHPEELQSFMAAYAQSVEFVNSNNAEAAALIGAKDIVPEGVALKALPYCNIVCITGDEMKEMLSEYLGVLFEQNPKAVGGQLPDYDFYFGDY